MTAQQDHFLDNGKVLIIIPAHNEEKSIGNIIKRVRSAGFYNIVVVDDKSTDATRDEALTGGAIVLPLKIQLGAWGATQTGIRYGSLHGFDYFITMDADGQHSPELIPKLLRQFDKTSTDVLVGSYPKRGSKARKVAWCVFRKLSGIKLEDLTSGLRVYNKRSAELLSNANVTIFDYQDLGVLLYLTRRGLRIKETPVAMRPRLDGKSRIFNSWGLVAKYVLNTLVLCLSMR